MLLFSLLDDALLLEHGRHGCLEVLARVRVGEQNSNLLLGSREGREKNGSSKKEEREREGERRKERAN